MKIIYTSNLIHVNQVVCSLLNSKDRILLAGAHFSPDQSTYTQWRTEGGVFGGFNPSPPPRNS